MAKASASDESCLSCIYVTRRILESVMRSALFSMSHASSPTTTPLATVATHLASVSPV